MTLRSKWIRWGLLVTGGVLLVALVLRIGPRDIARALSSVGPSAALLAVPYFVGTAITALPWGLLLPSRARPTLLGLFSSRFAASGANALLFGLGGEPCRLLWLAAADRSVGLAAIVLDRLLFNASTALFLAGGVVALEHMTTLPRLYSVLGAATALGVAMVSASAGWAFVSRGVGHRVHGLVRKVRREAALARCFGGDVDASFRELLRRSCSRLLAAVGIHLAARVVLAIEVLVALRVLGAHVEVPAAILLASTQVALSAIVSWVPSQVGIHEGGQAIVCAALGIDPALGVAAVLLQRIRQVAFIGLTPILLASAAPRLTSVPARST